MDLRLRDRVALLMGATNEIGQAVCYGPVNEGAKAAFSDINQEKGQALATEIARAGGDAIFLRTDVRECREGKDHQELSPRKARNARRCGPYDIAFAL